MDIAGKLVRVRDRQEGDSIKETIWRQDSELAALNPPTIRFFNRQLFSIETSDGEHIGRCSLNDYILSEVQLGIEIGDRKNWDKGYGTEAVNILVNYCLTTTNVERIWLKVLPRNGRAIRCYEKCGFIQTGQLALCGYNFITMERRREYYYPRISPPAGAIKE